MYGRMLKLWEHEMRTRSMLQSRSLLFPLEFCSSSHGRAMLRSKLIPLLVPCASDSGNFAISAAGFRQVAGESWCGFFSVGAHGLPATAGRLGAWARVRAAYDLHF